MNSVDALEEAVLRAMCAADRPSLERLLTEDFVITTAGWLTAPANRSQWLDGLTRHQLREFRIDAVDERRIGDVTVALVLSRQAGQFAGREFDYAFRYTDVWVGGGQGSLRLAVRHASIVPEVEV